MSIWRATQLPHTIFEYCTPNESNNSGYKAKENDLAPHITFARTALQMSSVQACLISIPRAHIYHDRQSGYFQCFYRDEESLL